MNPNEQPVMDIQPRKQMFEAPNLPPQTPPEPTPLQEPPVVGPKKSKRGMVIVVIICVVLVLAAIGAAGYFYLSSKTTTLPQTLDVSEPVDDGRVDVSDVDALSAEVDDAVKNLNDSADFGPNDLSDSTIGL